MRKAVKYDKKGLKATLLQLRNLCADFSGDPSLLLDYQYIESKQFKELSHAEDYPPRATPPSQTQLWLARATTRALYDERSPYIKGGLMHEADLPAEVVVKMKVFVNQSAQFHYLLRFSSTLSELGDVSCLWMREFYLELCKRVQVCQNERGNPRLDPPPPNPVLSLGPCCPFLPLCWANSRRGHE